MGASTMGRIKGFIRPEEILNFIKQKYDKNAVGDFSRKTNCSLDKCNWEYKINEHSDDNNHWYSISGFIHFNYNNEKRSLFYMYDNLNHLEDKEYYEDNGLEELLMTETTHLNLNYWGSSVLIIKEIVAYFGGGWIDENDCDSELFYPISLKEDKSINPVIYVTMEEINEKFGGTVVIIKK